jgi:hypothetical protein
MLINDVRILENIEILSEAKSPQGMRIRGLFQRADEQNNNNRVYPKTVLESQVKSLQEMITENRLCGELDHPSHDIVKLSNASHLITGLYMKGNDVIGEAKVLDTPAGKVAQALIEGGVKVGISSRGVGTLTEDTMNKVKYVNEDYKLVTFDLVADPSTRGAFPGLSESTEISEQTRQIVNDTYKKALGEKVFVTMLRESFENSLSEADQPYESDESSYDDIMKMRGYPSVDDIMKRGKVKEDPFYKAMMAAVKGATPVKSNEISMKAIDKRSAGMRRGRAGQLAQAQAAIPGAEKTLKGAEAEHGFQQDRLARASSMAQRRQNRAPRRSMLQRVAGVFKGQKFGDRTQGETERYQGVRDREADVARSGGAQAQAKSALAGAQSKLSQTRRGSVNLTPAQLHDKAVANAKRKTNPANRTSALKRLGSRPADDHKGIERERPDKSDSQRLAAIKKRHSDPVRQARQKKAVGAQRTRDAAKAKRDPNFGEGGLEGFRQRARAMRTGRARRNLSRNRWVPNAFGNVNASVQPTYDRMAEFLGEAYNSNLTKKQNKRKKARVKKQVEAARDKRADQQDAADAARDLHLGR